MERKTCLFVLLLAIFGAVLAATVNAACADSSARLTLKNAVVVQSLALTDETAVALDAGSIQHAVVCIRNLQALCAALQPGDVVTIIGDLPALDADDQRLHVDVLAVKLAAEVLPDPLPVDRD